MADSKLPLAPKSLEETGLSRGFLQDLALKTIYFVGEMVGRDVARNLHLPFTDVVEVLLRHLRDEKYLEVRGGDSASASNWKYCITDKGRLKVAEVFTRDTYCGPAPVPLAEYQKSVLANKVMYGDINRERTKEAFADLIIDPDMIDKLGPAINSGKSMFLYGYPGNGKTAIAERICRLMGGNIVVPYAVEVDNQVIKFFDPFYHFPVEPPEEPKPVSAVASILKDKKDLYDNRWVEVKRPMIMVGGELTMATLDLIFSQDTKFYEAPFQMKSNGGILLIDDFGRQQMRPQDLLNRWIVPLEKRVDFLTLHTGKKIEVPFEQLIIFSTNIDPADLVDDAFLRRIRYKVEITDPSVDRFKRIFQLVCKSRQIEYRENMIDYMIEKHYQPKGKPLRGCHARDLLDQIGDQARYLGVPPELNESLIDGACGSYFVELR
ncbi:MAG TPA: ATP-binding protein [bacterium]|nr:ATP-binding protein [bacterium]